MKFSRRRFLLGTSSITVLAGLPKKSNAWFRGFSSGQAVYAQGMGATDASGFVISFPFGAVPLNAASAWTTGTPNITMAAGNLGTVTPGMSVYDITASAYLGQVLTYSGTALVLAANAAHASSGSTDSLVFTASINSVQPVQVFVDSTNGNDISYNGFSPYPGFKMNGTGPNSQYGATGQGSANSAYGPKATFNSGYSALPSGGSNRCGNQLFLAEGGSYTEGAAVFTGSAVGNQLTVSSVTSGFIGIGLVIGGNPVNLTGFIDDGSGAGSPSGVAGTVLTVQSIQFGTIVPTSIPAISLLSGGTFGFASRSITSQLSGTTGGVGFYQLSGSAVIIAPEPMIVNFNQSVITGFVSGTYGGTGIYTFNGAAVPAGAIPSIGMFLNTTDSLNNRSGYSVPYPMCVQSYNIADPLNLSKQGRALGAARPILGAAGPSASLSGTISNSTFTGIAASGTLTVSGFSGTALAIGQIVVNPSASFTATITGFGTGSGGNGTYTISNANNASSASYFVNSLTVAPGSVSGVISIGQYLTGVGIPPNVFVVYGQNLVWSINVPLSLGPSLAITTGGVGKGGYGNITFSSTANPQTIPYGYYVGRGINFSNVYDNANQVGGVGNPYGVLFENCTFPFGALGVGSSISTGFANAQNVIFRFCSVGNSWRNDGGHPAGFGTGHTDGLVIENCIVYNGGWKPSAANIAVGGSGRQEATFTATISGGTLSVTNVQGTIAIGQGFTFKSGLGYSGTITGGSGSSWTTNLPAATVSTPTLCISWNNNVPTIFNQGLYMSYGSNDQSILRRSVVVNCSASGLSGRGALIAYNNVMIDNPVQMVAGGGVNPNGNYTVSSFTGTVSGTLLTVTALANPQPNSRSIIVPSTTLTLVGAGLTGSPAIVAQVFPLTGGETIGGLGRYTLSVSQSALGPQSFTTTAFWYQGESPGGVLYNYHDNLILGGNNLNDINIRFNGIAVSDGQPGSSMQNNLFANKGAYGIGGGYMFQTTVGQTTPPAGDVPSYDLLTQNVSYNFSPTLEDTNVIVYPANNFTTYGGGGVSPGNNVVNDFKVSSGTYNSGTGVVSLTLATAATFPVGSVVAFYLSGSGTNIASVQSATATSTVVSGTNVQFNVGAGLSMAITGGDLSFTPATNNQVYQALGYANRDALVADMIVAPEIQWARNLMAASAPLFNGFPFQYA